MSKALKCDHCKTCFDPSESKGEFTTFGDIFFQNGTKYKNHEISYREDGPAHLCPKCTRDFKEWFYNYDTSGHFYPLEEQCTSSENYNTTQKPMKFSDFQKNDLPPSASCASSKAEDAAKQKRIITEIDAMALSVVRQLSDLAESLIFYDHSQK